MNSYLLDESGDKQKVRKQRSDCLFEKHVKEWAIGIHVTSACLSSGRARPYLQ